MAISSPTPPGARPRIWTDPQRRAIDHDGGDLLISAAAGSGKTAVLSERCARLVCETPAAGPPCAVENLLVLTFTEAAAREMKNRIATAIGEKLRRPGLSPGQRRWLLRQSAMIDGAAICTLDAFCARLLRQHFHEAQIDPAFDIIAEDEARMLREDVLDEVLVRFHKLDGAASREFADFLEAYAQGREITCRDMILALHHMLATTADPAAFLAAARAAYQPAGAAAVCDDFIRHTLPERLRLAEMLAQRSWDEVRHFAAAHEQALPLAERVAEILQQIQSAKELLSTRGIAGWKDAQAALSNEPSRLPAVRGVPEYTELKDRLWQPVKDRLAAARQDLAVDPHRLLGDLCTLAKPLDTLLALAADFTRAYAAAKRSENRLDFADLERLSLDLFSSSNNFAVPELRHRYHHVLVDEFQDINPLQNALLEKLANPARFNHAGNLFAVGDVKQSIYGFRLAEPGLFLEREKRLRAVAGRTAFLTLPHNFRSRPALIAAMNGIFSRLLTPEVAGIDYADGHALQADPHAPNAPDNAPPVEIHLIAMKSGDDGQAAKEDPDEPREEANADSPENPPLQENLTAFDHEARMVADRIAALMQENRQVIDRDGTTRPLLYRDIAILLRTMKRRAMLFVRALSRRGIPVHADLSTGFFDSPEIKDALALLHLLDNASQDVPLATTLLSPFGHFSHDDLARIRLAFDRREVPFHAAAAAYAPAADAPQFSPDLAARLADFFGKISRWRELLRTQPLHEALAAIFSESKIYIHLSGLEAAPQRIANLQMLCHRALAFGSFRRQGLHRFLRFIERLAREDSSAGEAPVLSEASNVVRIMSVHKSKGLEFPIVFVSGLGGKNPLHGAGPVLLHRDLGVGLAAVDLEADVYHPSAAGERIRDAARRAQCAEELRLLYVALTRARDQLILTGHVADAGTLQARRDLWQHHAGPLPEDLLLKSAPPLEWLIPAIASDNTASPWPLHVAWTTPKPGERPHIAVSLHSPSISDPSAHDADRQSPGIIARLLSGEALPPVSPASSAGSLPAALARIGAIYPHLALARQPAVQTVTFLKTQAADIGLSEPEEPPPVLAVDLLQAPGAQREARATAARDRGIATHRILELLDFSACDSATTLDAQMERLLRSGKLLTEEAAAADHAGIRWFLLESAAGRRLRERARQIAAGDRSLRILRELPFTWSGSAQTQNSKLKTQNLADAATIRGVIDLLLVQWPPAQSTAPAAAPIAEILDYKTDSESTWQGNLDAYRRQMHYYLAAAGDILRFPVSSATLIFLSARAEIGVVLPGVPAPMWPCIAAHPQGPAGFPHSRA